MNNEELKSNLLSSRHWLRLVFMLLFAALLQVAGELIGDMEPYTTELLSPDADPQLLFNQLQISECQGLLLVSHQPLVSKILDTLCGTANDYHDMATSSLACIDIEIIAADMGKLRWLRHSST